MSELSWLIMPKTPRGKPIIISQFPFIIGSDPASDYVIDHPAVSGFHVQCNADGKRNLLFHALDHGSVTLRGTQIERVRLKAKKGVSFDVVIGGEVNFDITYGVAEALEKLAEDSEAGGTDDTQMWFYEADGQEYGPLTVQEIFEAVDQGVLRPHHTVWNTETNRRVKGYEVKGLFADEAPSTRDVGSESAMDSVSEDSITCPYCWHRFLQEDILYIASHPSLIGDSVLGSDELQRFLPSRLTPDGLAVDEEGLTCTDTACPRCHMRLPNTIYSYRPFFLSLVGAPGSGKSYFLASMTWQMRTTLPRHFSIRFMDVDALTNQWINDYEEKLFLQSDEDSIQSIAKTEQQAGHVYKQVYLNGMAVTLPLPCMFSVQSNDARRSRGREEFKRCLVLYDNAGEHFQAGQDRPDEPGTQHLIRAEGILFFFDPTEDARFRRFIASRGVELDPSDVMRRQDTLLVEMISRIRRHLGLGAGVAYDRPLVLGVSKADVFGDLFNLDEDPWRWNPQTSSNALDMNQIMTVSFQLRDLLDQFAPEVVAAAESFSSQVIYIPNSALGHTPGNDGIRPKNIRPKWVDVPILYMMAKAGMIDVLHEPGIVTALSPEDCDTDGDFLYVKLTESGRVHKIPVVYAGYTLRCPDTGHPFRVPQQDDVRKETS